MAQQVKDLAVAPTVVQIQSLAQELLRAMGVAQKEKEKAVTVLNLAFRRPSLGWAFPTKPQK